VNAYRLSLAILLGLSIAVPSSAKLGQVRVNKIHVKNNSAGDAIVKILYDCDADGDGVVDPYGCQLGSNKMEGNQNIAAGQDAMIGKSDIGDEISSGTRIGLKISNGAGKSCQDKHPPDGDNVIYTTSVDNTIQFKVTGDAISGLSCHFQKD